MRLFVAFAVATLSGYIALSYEIVWVRTYSFMTQGEPRAFGFLLGAYLTGLACGSFFARRYCHRTGEGERYDPLFVLGLFLLAANVSGFCVIPAVAFVVSFWTWPPDHTLPIFAFVAALLGTGLPLVAHYGIPPDDNAGARLSYLYAGNILGSAAGSLTTGFVLLDTFSLRGLAVFLALLGVLISGALILVAAATVRRRLLTTAVLTGVAELVVLLSPVVYNGVYEKLQYQDNYVPGIRFAYINENKSGIITVSMSGAVYGGGSYDGQFNTSPLPGRDVNRVVRAYAVAAFHPAPRAILMIGLGSGSWLQVLANHPDVDTVTVVEINPGYVDIVSRYSVVASVLENPKVEIIIDDGRRYMQRTNRRFDVIVQNTIVYWRAHATNLLSREYLELSRQHLKQGGVVYYNTTASTAAQKTGAAVFPYVWRFQNMLIASDGPIEIDRERWRRKLRQWRIDGREVLNVSRHRRALEAIIGQTWWRGRPAWEDRGSILRRTQEAPVITDDNMATEWWAYGTYP